MGTFLVVAHQTAATRELRDALLAKRQEDRRAVFVLLVPATPLEKLLSTVGGDSVTLAEQSIRAASDALQRVGIDLAQAMIGDPDPLTAIQDEFRRARRTYEGIYLCTLPSGTSRWLELGLEAEVEALFGVPLVHVVASGESVAQRPAGPVVTFSVSLGSGGAEIARRVAQLLELNYYDWEITSVAAKLAGVTPEMIAASERAQSLMERVLDRLGSAGIYDEEASIGRLGSATMSSAIRALSSREYRALVEDVVRELGLRGGCVLVGHASQIILGDIPGVFKASVSGSSELRARRVSAEEGRTLEDARKLVHDSDEERQRFFKQVYQVDLRDARLYDLTLNSDQLSAYAATAMIIDGFNQRSWNLEAATA